MSGGRKIMNEDTEQQHSTIKAHARHGWLCGTDSTGHEFELKASTIAVLSETTSQDGEPFTKLTLKDGAPIFLAGFVMEDVRSAFDEATASRPRDEGERP